MSLPNRTAKLMNVEGSAWNTGKVPKPGLHALTSLTPMEFVTLRETRTDGKKLMRMATLAVSSGVVAHKHATKNTRHSS